jgi:hypothetical protein
MAVLTEAVAAGELSPEEGQSLAALVETHRKAIEIADLEQRIAALETRERNSEPRGKDQPASGVGDRASPST